jgi:DNA polymerase III epsilon subunit-like protein
VKILFLDTETSSLTPNTGQIIEIGGEIVELDQTTLRIKNLAEFESLVALRSDLDEKITRITGITKQELSSAKVLFKVQESWLEWLEKMPDIDFIVGHSINFDLNFLKSEGWFLPQKAKIIDTLTWARILLPDKAAINLEFLVENLKFEINSNHSHHRSLFDSIACRKLFEFLLLRIKAYKLPKFFIEFLKSEILTLPVEFFSLENEIIKSTEIKQKNLIEATLEIDGELIKPTLQQKIDILPSLELNSKFEELISQNLPLSLKIIIAQLYLCYILKQQKPETKTKFHGQGRLKEYYLADIVIDYFLNVEDFVEQKSLITGVEGMLWKTKKLTEKSLNLDYIIDILDCLNELLQLQPSTDLHLSDIQKIITEYDFFRLNLEKLLFKGRFYFNHFKGGTDEETVKLKFDTFFKKLLDFAFSKDSKTDSNLINLLLKTILENLQNWQNYELLNAEFNISSNYLYISVLKSDFNLNFHFNSLVSDKNVLFDSYLPEKELESFKIFSGLNDLKITSKQDETDFIYVDNLDLYEFYEQKIMQAKEQKSLVFILSGLNSSLNDSKKVLSENFNHKDYLVLGDSGSITKINSKIIQGFTGVVLVKFNNLSQILKSLKTNPENEFWMLNQPYFYVHKLWKDKSKNSSKPEEYLEVSKKLYILSQQYYYYFKYGVKLGLIRSY